MFKNKSPIGKQNFKNDRLINQQLVAEPLTLLKNITRNYEHTFAQAKRAQNHNLHKTPTLPQTHPHSHPSDTLNLQCNETLEIFTNPAIGADRPQEEIDEDLLCEQELAPVSGRPSKELNQYVRRLQMLLYEYMRRDMQNNQYIKNLEEQRELLAQQGSRQDEQRGRPPFRK